MMTSPYDLLNAASYYCPGVSFLIVILFVVTGAAFLLGRLLRKFAEPDELEHVKAKRHSEVSDMIGFIEKPKRRLQLGDDGEIIPYDDEPDEAYNRYN